MWYQSTKKKIKHGLIQAQNISPPDHSQTVWESGVASPCHLRTQNNNNESEKELNASIQILYFIFSLCVCVCGGEGDNLLRLR